jgi:hypothetical protein
MKLSDASRNVKNAYNAKLDAIVDRATGQGPQAPVTPSKDASVPDKDPFLDRKTTDFVKFKQDAEEKLSQALHLIYDKYRGPLTGKADLPSFALKTDLVQKALAVQDHIMDIQNKAVIAAVQRHMHNLKAFLLVKAQLERVQLGRTLAATKNANLLESVQHSTRVAKHFHELWSQMIGLDGAVDIKLRQFVTGEQGKFAGMYEYVDEPRTAWLLKDYSNMKEDYNELFRIIKDNLPDKNKQQ